MTGKGTQVDLDYSFWICGLSAVQSWEGKRPGTDKKYWRADHQQRNGLSYCASKKTPASPSLRVSNAGNSPSS